MSIAINMFLLIKISLIFYVNWSNKSKSDIIPDGLWNKRVLWGRAL